MFLAKAVISDSVLWRGRFIDFVLANVSPGEESLECVLVLTFKQCRIVIVLRHIINAKGLRDFSS